MEIEKQFESFSLANREKYFAETSASLNALLDDVFGEDQNELRQEFPSNCKKEGVKISSSRVSITYLNGEVVPFIEVLIQISFEDTGLGEYQSIYNLNGVLEDESFFFE